MIRSVVEQLHRLHPRFLAGTRLLFLDDPIEPDWEDMTFIVRLSYLDDTLVIDRAKKIDPKDKGKRGPAKSERVRSERRKQSEDYYKRWEEKRKAREQPGKG